VRFLLDTNICIAIMNRNEFGRSSKAKRAAANLRVLLSKVGVVPFDLPATQEYGTLRAELERLGRPVGASPGSGVRNWLT
jgi:predicted nucleic acid-binding protein